MQAERLGHHDAHGLEMHSEAPELATQFCLFHGFLVQSVVSSLPVSTPDMIGRPGCRTMEMNGGSSASYLARVP